MTLTVLIASYGYYALFVGTFLESYLSVILPGYMVLTQAMKGIYTRKYGW